MITAEMITFAMGLGLGFMVGMVCAFVIGHCYEKRNARTDWPVRTGERRRG